MFFKKKQDSETDEPEKQKESETTDPIVIKLNANFEKLKAQFGTFMEFNKANTERFTRINEQIGELRTMMMDKDKASRVLEAKATQAIDMVETVQPDKLMTNVRKQDAKIDALKGNIESNELMLKNSISEMHELRNKMNVFTGIEQVMKLNEEVKHELTDIRKVASSIQRHGDKVDTIFSEMQKSYSNLNRMQDHLQDLDKSIKGFATDIDNLKTRSSNYASKKDLEELNIKMNTFEKHIENMISLFTKKIESADKDMDHKNNEKIKKMEKLLTGFETLAKKTPDLDKYFNLLEAEAKAAINQPGELDKIKSLGEESKQEESEEETKKGFLHTIISKLKKKQEE